ncbi:MAG: AAA domain-containing protein [Chloroherpetonaceae bacterium]
MRLTPQPSNPDSDVRSLIEKAQKIWTERLIDLSRNNPLLFYRHLKTGTLDLSQSPALEQLLAGKHVSAKDLLPRNSELVKSNGTNAQPPQAISEKEINDKLVAIRRKAQSNYEEKGIETLHLAVGIASWQATDNGSRFNAPVLLIPARIESRRDACGNLRLSLGGTPQINPVLKYVLEKNHSIHLNHLDMSQDDIDESDNDTENKLTLNAITSLFDKVKSTAKDLSDFTIQSHFILANFQFAKMAMVEDLKRNQEALMSSSIIAAIAGHAPSRQNLAHAVAEINPRQLDHVSALEDYLVLDADSSQQLAIVMSCKGQSCVIQGPPGTGKSQTIANLIVQSIAEGRRVLFVAEKRAALDAVLKRLSSRDVDLGYLVLDLHDASVSRREVFAKLGKALERVKQTQPLNGFEKVYHEFEERRKALNEHAWKVNEVRPPTGLSVNQMVGKLARLPKHHQTTLRLRSETMKHLTEQRADEIKHVLNSAAAHATLFLGTNPSAWNNAKIRDGEQVKEALNCLDALFEHLPSFTQHLENTVNQLGIAMPNTVGEVKAIVSWLNDVKSIRQIYSDGIFLSPLKAETLAPAARGKVAEVWAMLTDAAYRATRRHMLKLRREQAPTTTLLEEARKIEDAFNRWQKLGATSSTPLLIESKESLEKALSTLLNMLNKLDGFVPMHLSDEIALKAISDKVYQLARDRQTPFLLPTISGFRSHIQEVGLEPFIDDLRTKAIPAEDWSNYFEQVWLSTALEQAWICNPALASFNGRTHERLIEEFKTLDVERRQLAAKRVRKLHAERTAQAMKTYRNQADLISREVAKQKRHISLRELFKRAPDVLTQLMPCWMASPLSVSQLLECGKEYFDLVIFDEASQIFQEEAIPSLYRAKQVVAAGDRHQLPPTNFFATGIEEEDNFNDEEQSDDSANAIKGFESLLDTLQSFLPNYHLDWHYRSADERLIAFSNAHIYGRRLVTFPSASNQNVIRHIVVPHHPNATEQEESASREVERVVQEVIMHAQTHPNESLGVITMGLQHAERIEAVLNRELAKRTDLSEFFAQEKEERFFVKNLETVQGDERDAIILSIGYGKTANGDLPHRFGPLMQEVGYRRLNVAITRARRRMCVISSFSHDDIDLSRSNSRGVQLLKAYLEYAASGGKRMSALEHTSEVALNPFEADVRDALEARGIKIKPQFGAARYRIDLVAMHPQKLGKPVLAIECDGASYHSSATARDRDRLRQTQLEQMGWRFHRIWSMDWFYRREQEIERAVAAYHEAVQLADGTEEEDIQNEEIQDTVEISSSSMHASMPQQASVDPRRGARPELPKRESINEYSDEELMLLADWVMSDGVVRTEEELIKAISKELSFSRTGNRIRERLSKIVKMMNNRSFNENQTEIWGKSPEAQK